MRAPTTFRNFRFLRNDGSAHVRRLALPLLTMETMATLISIAIYVMLSPVILLTLMLTVIDRIGTLAELLADDVDTFGAAWYQRLSRATGRTALKRRVSVAHDRLGRHIMDTRAPHITSTKSEIQQ